MLKLVTLLCPVKPLLTYSDFREQLQSFVRDNDLKNIVDHLCFKLNV